MNSFQDYTKDELDAFEDYLIDRQHEKWGSPTLPPWHSRSLGDVAPELTAIVQKLGDTDPSEHKPLLRRAYRLLSPHVSRTTAFELYMLVLPQSYVSVRLILRDRKASELTKHHLGETKATLAARQDHIIGLEVLRAYRAAVRAGTSAALATALDAVANKHEVSDHRIKQRYDRFRDRAFADGIADGGRIARLSQGIAESDPLRLSDFPKPWRGSISAKSYGKNSQG